MKRFPDWEMRIAQFIHERRALGTEWGVRDYLSLCTDWIAEYTGETVEIVKHATKAQADAAIKKAGGLEQAVTRVLGEPMDNPTSAQRGDIAMVEWLDGYQIGVVTGAQIMVQGLDFLIPIGITRAKAAWAVGRG